MKKKISFLFVCLMAFALGYSINNIAISDTAPKIAVVDLQKILTSSSKVQQLKADQEKKVAEIQNTLQKAQSEIANEKDPNVQANWDAYYKKLDQLGRTELQGIAQSAYTRKINDK